MKTQRTLAVLAAILFVVAVALATVSKQTVALGGVVAYFGGGGTEGLHGWVLRFLGPRIWDSIVQPLLIRPAWLPFASLGIVVAGAALSWPIRDAAHRSHRRG